MDNKSPETLPQSNFLCCWGWRGRGGPPVLKVRSVVTHKGFFPETKLSVCWGRGGEEGRPWEPAPTPRPRVCWLPVTAFGSFFVQRTGEKQQQKQKQKTKQNPATARMGEGSEEEARGQQRGHSCPGSELVKVGYGRQERSVLRGESSES